MTSISTEHECIFVHIPRCAGTAMKTALFEQLGGHLTSSEWRKRCSERWRDYFKFTFIRNPWDRTVSNYEYARMSNSFWHGGSDKPLHPKHQVLQEASFDEFVDLLYRGQLPIDVVGQDQGDRHLFSLRYFIGDGCEMDFIGRLENLAADFKIVCDHLGLEDVELPVLNASSRRPYSEYYCRDTRRKVGEVYRADIRTFGFDF